MANSPSSKKTYTIHITYTTNSPTSELKSPQNNASPTFSKTNTYSNQDKQWQNQYGYKNSGNGNNQLGKTKSILKAQPSDYQGFTFQMNDTGPTYCKTGKDFHSNFAQSSGFGNHSKRNRRVRLLLDEEHTAI